MNDSNPEIKKLNTNFEDLSKRLKDLYSYKQVFFRGIVAGIGTAIGATIIAAIALTVLFWFFDLVGVRSTVEDVLSPNELLQIEFEDGTTR